jgi:hypothetical protein
VHQSFFPPPSSSSSSSNVFETTTKCRWDIKEFLVGQFRIPFFFLLFVKQKKKRENKKYWNLLCIPPLRIWSGCYTFTQHDPRARYTFDSEQDSPESQVCRKGPQSEECITVRSAPPMKHCVECWSYITVRSKWARNNCSRLCRITDSFARYLPTLARHIWSADRSHSSNIAHIYIYI